LGRFQWCDLGLDLDLDLDGLDQICPASTSTSKPEKCIEVEADANSVFNPELVCPAHYEAFLVFGQVSLFRCLVLELSKKPQFLEGKNLFYCHWIAADHTCCKRCFGPLFDLDEGLRLANEQVPPPPTKVTTSQS
jgi:hypothetical protein